jgi:hypothetical protein
MAKAWWKKVKEVHHLEGSKVGNKRCIDWRRSERESIEE